MSSKALLLLALVLLISSEVAVQSSSEKNNGEVGKETVGVDDAKHGGGYGGRGGYNGGRHGGYRGRCAFGCCRSDYYGRGCRRCCSYAGQAVDAETGH